MFFYSIAVFAKFFCGIAVFRPGVSGEGAGERGGGKEGGLPIKNVGGDGWHASKIPYAIYDQNLRFSLPYSCDLPKNSILIYDRCGRHS